MGWFSNDRVMVALVKYQKKIIKCVPGRLSITDLNFTQFVNIKAIMLTKEKGCVHGTTGGRVGQPLGQPGQGQEFKCLVNIFLLIR